MKTKLALGLSLSCLCASTWPGFALDSMRLSRPQDSSTINSFVPLQGRISDTGSRMPLQAHISDSGDSQMPLQSEIGNRSGFSMQTGRAQTGRAQTGTAQTGTAQNGTAQNGTAQNGTARNGTAQISSQPVMRTGVEKMSRSVGRSDCQELSVLELKKLASHDIVLMIDKSSSMSTPDCPPGPSSSDYGSLASEPIRSEPWQSRPFQAWPFQAGLLPSGQFESGPFCSAGGGITRWDWCRDQLANLIGQTDSILPRGLTVELFSTEPHIFTHVSIRQIPQIFSEYQPGGFTMEATAMKLVLRDYFSRREATGGNVRPLLIAVLTDGRPTNPDSLRKKLIEATYEMRHQGEIKITFLQVGQDPKGVAFVKEMAERLVSEGARTNIVSSKTFPQLLGSGLTRALLDCITEHGG